MAGFPTHHNGAEGTRLRPWKKETTKIQSYPADQKTRHRRESYPADKKRLVTGATVRKEKMSTV